MKRTIILCFLSVLLVSCTASATSSRPPRGNPNATVLVENFSDLQCPACALAHKSVIKPVLEQYGDQIRFEFKHFPLRSIHRFALDASEMAECAADQGKFWEFVDIAFERSNEISADALLEWADVIGLNVDQAERCWKSHSKRDVVLSDYKEGRERGVGGTPTFFVNGEEVQTGVDTMGAAIEAAQQGTINRL